MDGRVKFGRVMRQARFRGRGVSDEPGPEIGKLSLSLRKRLREVIGESVELYKWARCPPFSSVLRLSTLMAGAVDEISQSVILPKRL